MMFVVPVFFVITGRSVFFLQHIARRLFGGLGGEEDGPMIAQNKNPLAQVVDDD